MSRGLVLATVMLATAISTSFVLVVGLAQLLYPGAKFATLNLWSHLEANYQWAFAIWGGITVVVPLLAAFLAAAVVIWLYRLWDARPIGVEAWPWPKQE